MTSSELWSWAELVAASGGRADGAPVGPITGFTFDTRALEAGNVFVALKDQRDGHDFVTAAFKAGAAAAIVSTTYERKPGDGALLRADDPLHALEKIGIAARARLAADACVLAVTGSAGKTGTKEMLRACFNAIAPGRVHASEKSYNNHWGVPLTLARMPASTRFAVFEIGMNHAGEITPLSRMVRPHIALITTVLPAHVGNFPDGETGIAHAKAEIFAGVEAGGTAIVPADNPHVELLINAAKARGLAIKTFGQQASADARAVSVSSPAGADAANTKTVIDAATSEGGRAPIRFVLGMNGDHLVNNALAVVLALAAAGALSDAALRPLADLTPPPGRGTRILLASPEGSLLLIDESYNANPASMRAALATLATVDRTAFPRRVAVLGDMLELGPQGAALHRDLFDTVDESGIDVLFACGPLMKGLYDAAPSAMKGAWGETAGALTPHVLDALAPGDVVMVKASNGTRLGPLVEAIKARFGKGVPA